MTAASPLRVLLDAQTTERDFQQAIVHLAKLRGWLAYHTFDSRRSAEGYPDLTLAHPSGKLLFLECKTELGKVSAAQQRWIDVLANLGRNVQAAVVRPSDWDWIEQELMSA